MNVTEAPKRYPAPPLDILMHLARHLHDGQCRCVITFSSRLDAERIARAIQLSLSAEPVLGCRFVAHCFRPYWERLSGVERKSPLSIVETDNEHSIEAFLGAPFDPSAEIQVQARLFRGPADKLAVKLSHEAADAAGLLNYLGLVGDIYRELRTNPAYVPPPREVRRGQGAVLRNAGLRQLLRGCFHFSVPSPGAGFPVTAEAPGGPTFTSRRLEPDGFTRIKEYCIEHRATVNDVLLAAFYRTLFQILAPQPTAPLPVQITVNLRRHLPVDSERGVCDLTGVFYPALKNQSFDALVVNVRRMMASARCNNPWLGQALLLELISFLPYALIQRLVTRFILRQIAAGKSYPFFANLGIIDIRRFDFGDAALCDVTMFGPVPYPPGSILSIQTVGNTLTVTTCAWDSPNGRKAEHFLDAYFRELSGAGFPGHILRRGAA